MPLQQLVEYFNDRLEHEHNSGFRPFILENKRVHALYGPIKIGSTLAAVHTATPDHTIIGHTAQLSVAANPAQALKQGELDQLVELPPVETANSQTIINFDRLSRAVHMLNYLPQSHLDELLFLDVDPRHILGVKEDHGAYFEEVIVKCGLQTENVAITMTVNNVYARFFQSLLKGLNNYHKRGYRLALKFDHYSLEKTAIELISRAAPEFIGLSALNFERNRDSLLPEKLQQFNGLANTVNAQSILLDIEDQKTADLATSSEFNLVQGRFYNENGYIPVHHKQAITVLGKEQNDYRF
ncbi:hypothetical protein KEF85_04695 [Methylomonas paludis]|uniref:EAL domain-containing protein n=1 Tax=Methylomonas paludis TaxID=1173101 RepID=A0A975MQ62_9GAMM|nr:hypothetical protein [Methylomonas paludis]QWF71775.1 hypothetical protein KEF85_04695 [Methylomonas paludis]